MEGKILLRKNILSFDIDMNKNMWCVILKET